MRIAVISDVHGNLPALDAVLADVAASGADLTLNLGDILSGPLWPAETAKRLMALRLPTIRGNHERQLLTLPRERMGASDAFAAAAIGAEQRDWLASLPATLEPADDVFCCHGTPDSDLRYFLETVTPEGWRGADEPGLRASMAKVQALIDRELELGVPASRIVLMGFSQGCAMTLLARKLSRRCTTTTSLANLVRYSVSSMAVTMACVPEI